ncbi:hypothetical protein [Pseudomonas putida]|uniref:4Fe-4S ferredoxin-type domain-containing protein n=1 Tax=Pseudomonas putida TaxID=303 RepID=A0A8I1JKN2_PSEPU|nr:hypothetical protein [Pseudomonas putida]MBI6885801.1 hypothetical protein [Pseudomonas putida]
MNSSADANRPANLIPVITLEKPAKFDPCNGCGVCCIAQVCYLGVELGDDKNCKALISNHDGSYACGLVADPYRFLQEHELETWKAIDAMKPGAHVGEQELKKVYRDVLGAGRGCDCEDWF